MANVKSIKIILRLHLYEPRLPIPGVYISSSEWNECKALAERYFLLCTIHKLRIHLLQILRSSLKNKAYHHVIHDPFYRRVVVGEKLWVCSRTEAIIKLIHLFEK